MVRTKKWHTRRYRRTATWNLFVLYNKKTCNFSFLFQNLSQLLESRHLRILANTKKKPVDVICCLYKMKHWLLCRNKELWLVKKNHATVKLDSNSLSWNENLQRKQNWTAKYTNVKENAGRKCWKNQSGFVLRAACGPKSLNVSLNIAGVEKIHSENMRSLSTLDAIWFEFWMKGGLPTVEICVLCG